jgi:hypothetical protein
MSTREWSPSVEEVRIEVLDGDVVVESYPIDEFYAAVEMFAAGRRDFRVSGTVVLDFLVSLFISLESASIRSKQLAKVDADASPISSLSWGSMWLAITLMTLDILGWLNRSIILPVVFLFVAWFVGQVLNTKSHRMWWVSYVISRGVLKDSDEVKDAG